MRILLIRFSSFGDVTQALSLPTALALRFPDAEIHWVTRSDLAGLLEGHPHIHRVWAFNRKDGLRGLRKMIRDLRAFDFDLIYDAHNNLRSRLITLGLRWPWARDRFLSGPRVIRRSLKRWKRFLLFRFRVNLFEKPFAGQRDLLEPLETLGIPRFPPPAPPQMFLSDRDLAEADRLLAPLAGHEFWACAASAAHELKRWPVAHWQELIRSRPQDRFVLLGGPEDRFYGDIAAVAPERVLNLAGRCSLKASAAVVSKAKKLIANDTGLLHVAEQLGVPAIAMMGPAPFGFPCRPQTKILELDLKCRPCSKHGQGPCVNEKFHRCMVDISPADVARQL